MVKNKAAAQVSLPSQLIERIDATGAQEFVWRTDLKRSQPHWEGIMLLHFSCSVAQKTNATMIDWFTGLSEKFLSMPCGRLLVLAGTERLDKPMMIGQMQGMLCTL